jgi:hypothetical protein
MLYEGRELPDNYEDCDYYERELWCRADRERRKLAGFKERVNPLFADLDRYLHDPIDYSTENDKFEVY